MSYTTFVEQQCREITAFSGRFAQHADGRREPIFDGFTASGYRREYLLSELTYSELRAVATGLLADHSDCLDKDTLTTIADLVCKASAGIA